MMHLRVKSTKNFSFLGLLASLLVPFFTVKSKNNIFTGEYFRRLDYFVVRTKCTKILQ